ncbi:hypothetical protein FOL47_001558 [Perkinsus chesapeaki]|uniref:SCP domain-containing protein n=1 Tax=Perkinsus chesapeaki TaxID=330153 RepID=A0A7J6MIN6_PERCH|nr:hypothetical protein FOL47_001558 [Perkinsus chesapeaki]
MPPEPAATEESRLLLDSFVDSYLPELKLMFSILPEDAILEEVRNSQSTSRTGEIDIEGVLERLVGRASASQAVPVIDLTLSEDPPAQDNWQTDEEVLAALMAIEDPLQRAFASKTLATVIRNIIIHAPQNSKYCTLKLTNARVRQLYDGLGELLHNLGFEVIYENGGLLQWNRSASDERLVEAHTLLETVNASPVEWIGVAPEALTGPAPPLKPASPTAGAASSSRYTMAGKLTREAIADLTEQRLKKQGKGGSWGTGVIYSNKNNRRRIHGLDDLVPDSGATHFADDYLRMIHGPAGSMAELTQRYSAVEYLGRKILDLCNVARHENGKLGRLQWHDGVAAVARAHAEKMASGEASFSHDGFDSRCRQLPIPYHSAGENLAYSKGMPDGAVTTVNGWMSSPGHRKNLLTAGFTHCGVGCAYGRDGSLWVTQLLFVKMLQSMDIDAWSLQVLREKVTAALPVEGSSSPSENAEVPTAAPAESPSIQLGGGSPHAAADNGGSATTRGGRGSKKARNNPEFSTWVFAVLKQVPSGAAPSTTAGKVYDEDVLSEDEDDNIFEIGDESSGDEDDDGVFVGSSPPKDQSVQRAAEQSCLRDASAMVGTLQRLGKGDVVSWEEDLLPVGARKFKCQKLTHQSRLDRKAPVTRAVEKEESGNWWNNAKKFATSLAAPFDPLVPVDRVIVLVLNQLLICEDMGEQKLKVKSNHRVQQIQRVSFAEDHPDKISFSYRNSSKCNTYKLLPLPEAPELSPNQQLMTCLKQRLSSLNVGMRLTVTDGPPRPMAPPPRGARDKGDDVDHDLLN